MSQVERERKTQQFLKHFFALLDSQNLKGQDTVQATVKKPKGEAGEDQKNEKDTLREIKEADKEVSSLLQLEQRVALGNTLPQWVHLLCVHATPMQEPQSTESLSKRKPTTNLVATSSVSYIDTDMSESLFNFPHLECIPSPWIARRTPPSLHTRRRLLLHLQQRYDRQVQQRETCGSFVDAFRHALRQVKVEDGNSVGRVECLSAMESLFSVDSRIHHGQEPPLSLIAEVLFTEWCAAAEGDASFNSTTVPLHIIEDDLTVCSGSAVHLPCDKNSLHNISSTDDKNDESKGVSNTALVGTLTGLACKHPMSAAPREGAGKKALAHRTPRQRRKNNNNNNSGSSSSDYDDDEDYDDDDDDDDVYDGHVGFNDNDYEVHTDVSTVTEQKSQCRMSTNNNNSSGGSSRYNRQLNAFITRNTSAFRVPLASLVLNVFEVSTDSSSDVTGDDSCAGVGGNDRSDGGMAVMAMERYVKLARVEVHCRRGDLQWFVVGDSKRHRNLLESR